MLLQEGDLAVRTDLAIRGVLEIEIRVGSGAEDTALFEYPLGQADGQWWVLPVLERRDR
jgi:hypothetical protein